MFIGNITGGQTSYQRRDCTWQWAISYSLNILGMRLLGKAHLNAFRICSFYYSWSHMIHWDTFRFCWATITEYKSLYPSLDQISGLLLFSLWTLMTVFMVAFIWGGSYCSELKVLWVWYTVGILHCIMYCILFVRMGLYLLCVVHVWTDITIVVLCSM